MEKQKARFSNKKRSECPDYAVNYDNNFMLFLARKKGANTFYITIMSVPIFPADKRKVHLSGKMRKLFGAERSQKFD